MKFVATNTLSKPKQYSADYRSLPKSKIIPEITSQNNSDCFLQGFISLTDYGKFNWHSECYRALNHAEISHTSSHPMAMQCSTVEFSKYSKWRPKSSSNIKGVLE